MDRTNDPYYQYAREHALSDLTRIHSLMPDVIPRFLQTHGIGRETIPTGGGTSGGGSSALVNTRTRTRNRNRNRSRTRTTGASRETVGAGGATGRSPSPAARKKISRTMKARWAARRQGQQGASATT